MSRSISLVGKVAAALIGAAGAGWLGFQVKPSPFPLSQRSRDLGTVDLPPNLPEPVRRYYQTTIGNKVPRVESLVVWGRGKVRLGIWMPLRWWVAHVPGHDFRRHMEVTWFGLRVLTVVDEYIHGHGMTHIGANIGGFKAASPYIDQAASLILWAEAVAIPSLLITDPRIRWQAIDANTARLIVPFEDQEDALTFHFDPRSGLITRMEALRHKNGPTKVNWWVDILSWAEAHDVLLPSQFSITWADDSGGPWSVWDWEVFEWNVDLSATIPESGLTLSAEKTQAQSAKVAAHEH